MLAAAGTFATIDAIEIAIAVAIPAVLIYLLVRSFKKPNAKAKQARAAVHRSPDEAAEQLRSDGWHVSPPS